MQRDYVDGNKKDVIFFTGTEIERTPAYGMKTLFVVGIQAVHDILELAKANQCSHIFLGANHSFDLENKTTSSHWNTMMVPLLEANYLVSLDFDIKFVNDVLSMGWNRFNNFIPQISVKIPKVKAFNYNAMLKIDDVDFKATNPGVWCHSLHELLARDKFTDWREYKGDEPL